MEINNVLLVDDDDSIRFIGELTLSEVGGWNVSTAASGPDAIEQALALEIDLILLDVMMPGMDGFETLNRLRSDDRTRHIPVVFVTAKVQPHEIDSYLAVGAHGAVAKPFDPMCLPNQIREIVRNIAVERSPA